MLSSSVFRAIVANQLALTWADANLPLLVWMDYFLCFFLEKSVFKRSSVGLPLGPLPCNPWAVGPWAGLEDLVEACLPSKRANWPTYLLGQV